MLLPEFTVEHGFFYYEKKVVNTLDSLTFRLIECIIVKENRRDNNSLSDALDMFLRKTEKQRDWRLA